MTIFTITPSAGDQQFNLGPVVGEGWASCCPEEGRQTVVISSERSQLVIEVGRKPEQIEMLQIVGGYAEQQQVLKAGVSNQYYGCGDRFPFFVLNDVRDAVAAAYGAGVMAAPTLGGPVCFEPFAVDQPQPGMFFAPGATCIMPPYLQAHLSSGK